MFEGSDSSMALQRLQVGGVEELTVLFEANRNRLREMIRRRIVGKLATRFDESDIIQEAFIRAGNRLNAYLKAPNVHPHVWLRILCRQLLCEQIRRHMRECRTPARENNYAGGEQIIDLLIDSTDSVGTKLGRQEVMTKLMAELSDTDREILDMRHGENLKFREIAKTLEMKMDTIKKRYYRALQKLDQISRELNGSSVDN